MGNRPKPSINENAIEKFCNSNRIPSVDALCQFPTCEADSLRSFIAWLLRSDF